MDFGNELWRALKANQATIADLLSTNKEALETYLKVFADKEFMLHQAEGLAPHPVWNVYEDEESKFLKTVREVCVWKVPKDSNIITSHALYKIKANDDGSLKLKTRIAPHRNKHGDKAFLKTDSAQCPPTEIRILLSISPMIIWPLAKIDFTSAFLQTGDANRGCVCCTSSRM